MTRILRKRLGLIVAGAIATLSLIALTLIPHDVPAPVRSAFYPATAAVAASDEFTQSIPTVDETRLRDYVNDLAYRRFEAVDRDRARTYITDTLSDLGWEPQLETFDNGGINIVAEQPGTTTDGGTLLIGAHYDTVRDSPGADDNATAVATLLEVARIFAAQPHLRSLRLVFFDQEELGLLGSTAYASQPQNLESLVGAMVLDMVGYTCDQPGCQTYPEALPINPPTSSRGNFIGVIGDLDHPELMAALQSSDRPDPPPVFTLPVPLSADLPLDLARSDHVPFWQQGIGAVLVTDTANFRNPHYHQPTDTPDTLDFEFFTGVVQRVVDGVETLVNS